ncbi:hypothetical protein [Campylobacter fetus]|uniref:hypothetical protein n=1 Tax=Campylobacter fetus TaxID=196 RepID=UPI000818B50A|nr:hypothetical protein [Campylobacter fetus]RUT50975.1 hypothetical protein BWK67_00180 [Campylobacter fetus]RUT51703.1 hypothetical protein BWK51_00180 [Campylobacter fetus]
MKYIGCRTSKVEPELDTTYLGSSKHTPNHLVVNKEILGIFSNRSEALKNEIFWHNYHDIANNPTFYNKAKQTSTKFDTTGIKFQWTQEHYEHLINANKARIGWKHTDEVKKKISMLNKGKPGPKHSLKTIELIRQKILGKTNKYKGYTYTKEEADRIYAKKDKYQIKFHWIHHITKEKEYLTCRDFADKYINSPNRLAIINNIIDAKPRQRNRGGILYRNYKGWYLDPTFLLSYKQHRINDPM